MEICTACGSKSLMAEKYGTVSLCKMCALKVMTSKWKNKSYANNEEVEQQAEKVLNSAKKNGFSEKAIEGLTAYFNEKMIAGLLKIFDGHRGQKLTVCEDYCVIETEGGFDYKAAEKAYKKILSGNRGGFSLDGLEGIMSSQMAVNIIGDVVGGVIPGGKLIKKSIKQVGKSLAVNALTSQFGGGNDQQITPRRVALTVHTGERVIKYKDYDSIKCMEPVGEEEYGFILIQNSKLIDSPEEDVVFFFGTGTDTKKEANHLYSYMKERIEENKAVIQPDVLTNQGYIQIQQPQEKSSADEILKYKQLLDIGAITQEEYDAKKRQLLGV